MNEEPRANLPLSLHHLHLRTPNPEPLLFTDIATVLQEKVFYDLRSVVVDGEVAQAHEP